MVFGKYNEFLRNTKIYFNTQSNQGLDCGNKSIHFLCFKQSVTLIDVSNIGKNWEMEK